MLAAAAVAWLGFLVHNVADLPNQTLLSPETLWPGLVTLTLLVLYATGPAPVAGVALFGWALMNLAGGALSVLPLSVLPFQPEKTVRDYSFHLLYAATQVPLLVVAYQLAVATPSAPAREAARGALRQRRGNARNSTVHQRMPDRRGARGGPPAACVAQDIAVLDARSLWADTVCTAPRGGARGEETRDVDVGVDPGHRVGVGARGEDVGSPWVHEGE